MYLTLSLVEMVCVTARLAPSLPRPERPQRQGVRRESVENSLAAAAAKLSNMPVSCAVDPVETTNTVGTFNVGKLITSGLE